MAETKRRLLALAVLASVLAISSIWLFSSTTREPEVSNAQPSSEQAGTPDRARLNPPASPQESEPNPAREARVQRHLLGRLVLPPNTPADEQPRVEWFERAPAEDRWSAPPVASHTVEVDPEGGFAIELDSLHEELWLCVRGRYLYSRDPVRVRSEEHGEIVLEPILGAWVEGTLLTSAAEPHLGETEVELLLDPLDRFARPLLVERPEFAARRFSVTGGRFEFQAVAANARYQIQARPEGDAASNSSALLPRPGEHLQLELLLEPGLAIRGRVRDSEGSPVAGANLELIRDSFLLGSSGTRVRAAETDPDGRFVMEGLPAGTALLNAEHPSCFPVSIEIDVLSASLDPEFLMVLERGARIRGRVQDEHGVPIPNAQLKLSLDRSRLSIVGAFESLRGSNFETTSDSSGQFEFEGVGTGPFALRARTADELRAGELDGVPPGEDSAVVVVRSLPGVRGIVVDDQDQPVVAFEVIAERLEAGGVSSYGAPVRQTYESADGSFDLPGLLPGTWLLSARSEGLGDALEKLRCHVEDEVASDLRIVLPRGGAVLGRVVDLNGRPVADALVKPAGTRVDDRLEDQLARSTRSGPDGHFELTGLSAGAVKLEAEALGFAGSPPVEVAVEPGQVVPGVQLTLHVGGGIRGVLTDDRGLAQAGQVVSTQHDDHSSRAFARTDDSGAFQFERLVPGRHTLTVTPLLNRPLHGEGGPNLAQLIGGTRTTSCTVLEGEITTVRFGAPLVEGLQLDAQVVSATEPVAGALVFVSQSESAGSDSPRTLATDDEGRFTLSNLLPGPCTIRVSIAESSTGVQHYALERVLPDQPVVSWVLDLPAGEISGSVTDHEGGALGGITVLATPANGQALGTASRSVSTDPDGSYRIGFLDAGSYSLRAGEQAPSPFLGSVQTAALAVETRSDIRVQEGQRITGVDFELARGGSMEGTVFEPGGIPASGALLQLRDSSEALVARIRPTLTDADGRFSFEGLPPGSYGVWASTAKWCSQAPVYADVSTEEPTEVEIHLAQGVRLIVDFEDASGEPVLGRLSVLDDAGREWSRAESAAAADHEVGPLPPGSYRVMATGFDGTAGFQELKLSGIPSRKRLSLTLD